MKSIKPGRGTSMQSFAGSVFSIAFGILWTIMAVKMTSGAGIIGIIFPLFGLYSVGMGIMNAILSYRNATGKNRMSLFDIVEDGEEKDPLDPDWHKENLQTSLQDEEGSAGYCPYCGQRAEQDHRFCKKCGRRLR